MKYNFDHSPSCKGTWSIKWDQYGDEDIIALSNADMDFPVAKCITDKLTETARRGIFNYHLKPDSYYDTIIKWYDRMYGWKIKREWILNTPGVWVSTRMCFDTYAGRGGKVIVQTPHFHPIAEIAHVAGVKLVLNPMIYENGKYAIDFANFEQEIIDEKPDVYFMVNIQNPTGRLFTKEEQAKLQEICYRHHVTVIADEVHANMRYDGRKHAPAPSVSEEAMKNTVLINAASKAYNVMDLTYALVIIPDEDLRKKYMEQMNGYSMDFATNAFGIAGIEGALSPEADEWLEQVTEYVHENLEFLTEYCQKNLPQIKVIRPEGSFLVWLDCKKLGIKPEELDDFFLKKARVGLSSGIAYGEYGKGFERINLGCTRAVLTEGLERMKAAIDEYEKGR